MESNGLVTLFIMYKKEVIEMELLDVYDCFGNKTGRVVERGNKDEVFNDDEHIAVAIIYIENDKGEFLIQKTSKEKGGHYSSTGGHINHGEDALSAIIREVKEELEKMSYSNLEELATDNGGFVLDFNTPDAQNYMYFGEGYVNMDYPEGKYDILFTYKGKLAYFININLTKEPVE
jgi:hypothetical protein